jgi:rhodanese-related sulfurtransferase
MSNDLEWQDNNLDVSPWTPVFRGDQDYRLSAPVDADHLVPAALDRCLNAAEVRRLIWEGVQVVDARTAAEHLHCKIQGSTQLGIQPSLAMLQRLGLDRDDPIVCYSNHEQRARKLSEHLNALGYRSVYRLRSGLEGYWPRQDA